MTMSCNRSPVKCINCVLNESAEFCVILEDQKRKYQNLTRIWLLKFTIIHNTYTLAEWVLSHVSREF